MESPVKFICCKCGVRLRFNDHIKPGITQWDWVFSGHPPICRACLDIAEVSWNTRKKTNM